MEITELEKSLYAYVYESDKKKKQKALEALLGEIVNRL